MHYNTVSEAFAQAEETQEIDPLSIYHAFEQITNGRKPRGVRYRVALVLTLVLLGKLTGMTTLAAIAEWARWRADWLRQVLPDAPKCFPCAATYSNVLRAVAGAHLDQRAWAAGATRTGRQYRTERVPGADLGHSGPGLSPGTYRSLGRPGPPTGGLRVDQSSALSGLCCAAVGPDSGTLAYRKSLALAPRCDLGGRSLPSTQGNGTVGASRLKQRGVDHL